MKSPPIQLRAETWYLRRRVPKRFESVEPRKEVLLSLHTDSRELALGKWKPVWDNLIEAWEAKLAGDTADAEKRHAAAVELAAVRGFRYLPVREVTDLPAAQLLNRVEAAKDRREAAALLGTIPAPKITVSKALEQFWPLAKDLTLGKSPDQLRRWKNPRKKAVKNFIAVCGDKALDEIDRDDMLDFRQWWMERLEEEELAPNSGNKDIGHFGQMLKVVNEKKRLGLDLGKLLGELTFKEGEKRSRPPFSSDWIKSRLLAPKALAGLNKEARCIVLAMVNTGARPSELSTLNANTIHLEGAVPYIKIKTDGRAVKSPRAKRDIPLLGVSLEAMKECSDGFVRYFDKAGLSGTVNSYFDDNELRETPEHSLYSLRHSFEDRMLRAGIDYRIRKDLMGQRLNGEKYGDGATLDQAAALLRPISF